MKEREEKEKFHPRLGGEDQNDRSCHLTTDRMTGTVGRPV